MKNVSVVVDYKQHCIKNMGIMMDISDKNWKAMSDMARLKFLGDFVHHRLEQNKTQRQLAKEAGINRTTLSEFEHGKRPTH